MCMFTFVFSFGLFLFSIVFFSEHLHSRLFLRLGKYQTDQEDTSRKIDGLFSSGPIRVIIKLRLVLF